MSTTRSLRVRAAVVGAGIVLATLSGCGGDEKTSAEPSGGGTGGGTPTSSATTAHPDSQGVGLNGSTKEAGGASAPASSRAKGDPVRLVAPSIGLDKKLVSLGVNSSGEINPPAGVPQWYNKSVRPGKDGISVIAGHVMYDGPDVFYKLDQLDKGDVVTVQFAGGQQKKFKVYDEASVDKKTLQTDARVWGSSKTPVLALITCDAGSKVVGNHHVSNYVVWAAPV
ncbi:class F sortase [Luteipulveratus sp. YIM 133132]|uniref:class F sortase n=1 Tax=Luteipulveratus flavus TaxID=3031728 RepID=UPI0023B061D1|nr:class F sortase [Luteipulveratus sp. YIM 133132]MDE9366346.1 class F sortase [Luteipulveratus sp. YIM 133132]